MTEPTALDIANPAFRSDPYPFYKRLRAQAPVHRVTFPGKKAAWLVTRYDDVMQILKGKHFVKDKLNAVKPGEAARQPWVPGIVKSLMRNMLDVDAPDHTRLRTLVHKAFTPGMIEHMQQRIQTLADDLLDNVLDRGRMDLISDYALPIPTTIIAEMLGVPKEENHKFHRWSSAIVAIESATPSAWDMAKAVPNIMAFVRYIRKLVKARRAVLQEDLISALVQA